MLKVYCIALNELGFKWLKLCLVLKGFSPVNKQDKTDEIGKGSGRASNNQVRLQLSGPFTS
jgi:hypothetical protein